jgi:DNA polymerase-3 subunit delta'
MTQGLMALDNKNMPSITWPHCVGQQHIKDNLEAAVTNGTLGHAYLFAGQEGSGKFAAALDLALILLCDAKDNRPCMTCPSCQKVLHYAHPDFHLILPVELREGDKKDNKLTEDGWAHIAEEAKNRVQNVYSLPDHAKKPDIPVDWIRELNHAILRGNIEKNVSVTILEGVDRALLKDLSADSMLKLLEEPPAGTVFLLLTDHLSNVLPTIVSRCQILRFGWLSPDEIRAELANRFSIDPSDPRLAGVVHTGSLGRALDAWNHPADDVAQEAMAYWDLCRRGNWMDVARCIDRLSEWEDFSRYEQLFLVIMDRLRNSFLSELPGTENIFLGGQPRYPALSLPHGRIERLLSVCEHSIAAVRARGNITLVLANCASALTETLHGEKQQPR